MWQPHMEKHSAHAQQNWNSFVKGTEKKMMFGGFYKVKNCNLVYFQQNHVMITRAIEVNYDLND